ncbi:hypothetical protein BGX23_009826, partial [Mortierella sp. AD031]
VQEPRPQVQEPRSQAQEPRPQEPHPQESLAQESRLQELVGFSKHTLELPGGGRIALPSKKARMGSISTPAQEASLPEGLPRDSDTRRPQDSTDRAPVDQSSVHARPTELPNDVPVTSNDPPTESQSVPVKFNSPQLPFPVSLPLTSSTKASRKEDISPRETPTTKASSAHVRSRSSSPPPAPSSLRGHLGLGVEAPEQSVNGSSSSGKKSQQDGDKERDRPKATMSKDATKNSKTSTGGSSTPKEKKSSKKETVPDRAQDDDVAVIQKAYKIHDVSKKAHDMDEDMPNPKLPGKAQSTSKKSASSGQSQGTSLKKRFSRPAELDDGHLGSTGSKALDTQDSTSGHDRTTSSESSRGKSTKSHKVESLNNEYPSPKVAQKTSSSSNANVAKEKDEVGADDQADRGEGLYCICRTVYDPSRFMIACDGCDDWFHGDCVGVAEKDSDMVDKYFCKRCEEKGRHGSLKKKCFRDGCQKSAGRKSKYCSKECGLLVATQRIKESQERVFGESNQPDLPSGQVQQQHLQRRRRLTLADLDDRQRLLGIREKMAHVRKVCTILEERSKQLEICVDRQARQDLGRFNLSASSGLGLNNNEPSPGDEGKSLADIEEEDEGVLRGTPGSSSKTSSSSKTKSKAGQKEKVSTKDKDKDVLCGFDYSLVWDDAQDISRLDRAALSSLVSTPVGSRASSVAPPSFGVVVVNPKRNGTTTESSNSGEKSKADGLHDGGVQTPSSISGDVGSAALVASPYLEAIGLRVCTARKTCERHNGWQRLKAAELELEQALQNKLMKTLKAEAKLVKGRMKRRRNDLSARILNGTIEH